MLIHTMALFLAVCSLSSAEPSRDVTFYLVSDTHVGMNYRKTTPAFGSEAYARMAGLTVELAFLAASAGVTIHSRI